LLWSENFLGGFDSAWSLGRALGSDTLPSVQLVEDTPALTPYGSFWSRLETAVHNPPDRWVSGVMATAASPGDPVFYLHHCMIDLLWAQWQLRHPGEDRYQASGAVDHDAGRRSGSPLDQHLRLPTGICARPLTGVARPGRHTMMGWGPRHERVMQSKIRKQARDTLGQHGLADTWRDTEYVVLSCRFR
jgi:hypothetical protein